MSDTHPLPIRLENISVVLVDTLQGGNIGSAARALKNVGLKRMTLVRPQGYLSQECVKMAGRATELLAAARVCSTFDEAVGEENLLVGTTSVRDRKLNQRFYTPKEIAPIICNHASSQRVALVFGPENRGLTDAQLAQCQYHVSIPTHPDYPVLNVAQSVMILVYEIFNVDDRYCREHPPLASHRQREEMFDHTQRVLLNIGFLHHKNPHEIMRAIRRFLGRADLTPRDVQIVRGIMSHMEWYARDGYKLPPGKVRK